jgi:hypothetical protein
MHIYISPHRSIDVAHMGVAQTLCETASHDQSQPGTIEIAAFP